DPPRPLVQLGLGVLAAAAAVAVVQAEDRPVGGQLVRLEGPARVVRDHQRGVVRAQLLVDRLREPALVAELEAVAPRREQGERASEPVVVAPEVGRELPDDGAELARLDERLDALVVAPDSLGEALKPLDVGQVATRLGGEGEPRWRLLDPARDGVAGGQPVEGRVDLDRVEHLRVALEPAPLGQALRIERAAPAVVLPPRAADADGPHGEGRGRREVSTTSNALPGTPWSECRSSLSQPRLGAPLTYQDEPLSARIIPYPCSAPTTIATV